MNNYLDEFKVVKTIYRINQKIIMVLASIYQLFYCLKVYTDKKKETQKLRYSKSETGVERNNIHQVVS